MIFVYVYIGIISVYLYIGVISVYLYIGAISVYLYIGVISVYLYTGVISVYLYIGVISVYLYIGVISVYFDFCHFFVSQPALNKQPVHKLNTWHSVYTQVDKQLHSEYKATKIKTKSEQTTQLLTTKFLLQVQKLTKSANLYKQSKQNVFHC